ncbi:type II toxin-antitoxin system MqsA family antitoxin [Methylomonas paludis]|uniref:Type II toxin-antitoxin system MqsA family antitoxin n=1 Tax=Methylomonas paludis TaxID=1173101 RepID=A0A975R8X3_9GAMM|nr:type II toxin-antitoxin system MqsA family antitoxin [Methylomonas paludis]QWF70487.1 type II toxin-antitoxin system MqsA family antitoxin [Methylomonas paludis]
MTQSNIFCPVCHGGRKQPGRTTFTVELGFGVVVVRDVPALVCDLCGTDWLEDATAEKLEQIVEQARLKHPVVEVANWPQDIQALAS